MDRELEDYFNYLRVNDTDTYYHLLDALNKFYYGNSSNHHPYESTQRGGVNRGPDSDYEPVIHKEEDVSHDPAEYPPGEVIDGFVKSLDDVCNNTTVPNYYDLTQHNAVKNIFIVLYIIVIIVSFVGNFMVIWTVTRNRHMRTVTNYYIRNLAVCDFLVAALVMPLKLLEYTAPCSWQVFAKDALCSVIYYILPVFVFASVLTLVAISLERCHAIVHPLNSFTMHSKKRTRLILVATWLIPVIVASPYTYCRSYAFSIHSPYGSISRQICTDRFSEIDVAIYGEDYRQSGRFRKGFFLFIFMVMYMIPMIVIVTTCIRIAVCLLKPTESDPHEESSYGMKMTRKRGENKRRVARMIITVAIAFIVCWTPFYLVSFVSQVQKVSFLIKSNFIFTMLATHLSGFLNSAINPFIYHFMSEKFRKSFTIMARSLFCCPQNIWQRNNRRQYSWAMKCEEYYCQHKLQRQQSSSSHLHSKIDFAGGQGGDPRMKNYDCNKNRQTVHTKFNSQSKCSSSGAQNEPKSKNALQLQQQKVHYSNSKQKLKGGSKNNSSNSSNNSKNNNKSSGQKNNMTVVKNKQNTSLYCGPFCVCECQGCSIQSSSSGGHSSSHVQPYGDRNVVQIKGAQMLDTETETQLSYGQHLQPYNGVSTPTKKIPRENTKVIQTKDYIQMQNLGKKDNVKSATKFNNHHQYKKIDMSTNLDSKLPEEKGHKLNICIDVQQSLNKSEEDNLHDNESHYLLGCTKNTTQSKSDSNIYVHEKNNLNVGSKTNGVCKSSISSSQLLL